MKYCEEHDLNYETPKCGLCINNEERAPVRSDTFVSRPTLRPDTPQDAPLAERSEPVSFPIKWINGFRIPFTSKFFAFTIGEVHAEANETKPETIEEYLERTEQLTFEIQIDE